jgi:VanZ family protein/ferredoxin
MQPTMPLVRRLLHVWGPVALYAGALFAQSSFPTPEEVPSFLLSDKLLHAGAYAVLAVLFYRALGHHRTTRAPARRALFTIALTVLYGISDEFHQSFVPGRFAEHWDVLADRNSVDVPTLCHLKGTTPTGACRICVVEVEGARSLLASCSTPAAKGMVVRTESPAVVDAQSHHRIDALLGQPQLRGARIRRQDWTGFSAESPKSRRQRRTVPGVGRLPPAGSGLPLPGQRRTVSRQPEIRYPMETVNPFIVRDFSRCILCGRCVQACNEVQVNNAISFGYRGGTKIIAAGDRPLKDSDCVFCGECVQVCPVGALVEKDASATQSGHGKPGKCAPPAATAAWAARSILHVKDNKVVKVTGVEDEAPNYGSLCVKGRFGFDFIGSAISG